MQKNLITCALGQDNQYNNNVTMEFQQALMVLAEEAMRRVEEEGGLQVFAAKVKENAEQPNQFFSTSTAFKQNAIAHYETNNIPYVFDEEGMPQIWLMGSEGEPVNKDRLIVMAEAVLKARESNAESVRS